MSSPKIAHAFVLRLTVSLLVCAAWTGPVPVRAEESSASLHKQTKSLKVFGEDERRLVADTTRFPWSAVGLVQSIWYKSDNVVVVSTGTGALIGERVVLTVGHTVYSQEDGWASEITFVPARNGSAEPFGRARSIRTIAQRAWVEDKDNRYDIAMFVLDKPLGQQAGHLSVAVESGEFFLNRNLNSAGYPGETHTGDTQYHSFGISLDVQDGLIRHLLDSEPGQSGSPLWYYEAGTQNRRIVGVLTGSREINSGGVVVDSYNVAVHINEAFAGWIEDTLAEHDVPTEDVAVDESNPAEPVFCGAGLPAAAVMGLMLLPLARLRMRCPRGRSTDGL